MCIRDSFPRDRQNYAGRLRVLESVLFRLQLSECKFIRYIAVMYVQGSYGAIIFCTIDVKETVCV